MSDLRRARFRPDVRQRLREGASRGRPPLLLCGPPGSGKTTLLRALSEDLAGRGFLPLFLDLFTAASSSERLVAAAATALPARTPGREALLQRAAAGRAQGEAAVHALLECWATLSRVDGRPVVLLLDEVSEIRSLAYFPGLRDAAARLGRALAARTAGTVAATSYPTLCRGLWPSFEAVELGPLAPAELGGDAGLARASFGWPRYAAVLAERGGRDLETAWAEEMAVGGRLDQLCRGTYEVLLLRSRGYGICKAVLSAVAEDEGANLTGLMKRVGRTPGATRDYLGWLLGVDALRAAQRRYHYVDGMLASWVRLHGSGVAPGEAQLRAAARAILTGDVVRSGPATMRSPRRKPFPPPAPESPEPESEPARPTPSRRDDLMEID